MANTIRTGTPLAPRTVSYDTGNSSIQLDYCNFTVSSRNIQISRQAIKRAYRFAFTFVLAGDDSAELSDIRTNVERTLKQRGGILTVTEGGVDIFKIGPPTGPTVPGASGGTIDSSIRTTMFSDIEWGPTPQSLTIQHVGVGAYGEWVVDVVIPSEEAFVIGDTLILGIDAEVTYALDRNHYTTRTVVGRIHCANWGRSGTRLFGKDSISYVDQEAIKLALLAGQGTLTNNFMDPVRVPTGFVRNVQNFAVDNSENILTFIMIDQEVYRLFPQWITSAGATMQVSIDSLSAVQYVNHTLRGFCEAPKDVAKSRVLQACWEQIQDAIGLLPTRFIDDRIAVVSSLAMINHIYANRIDYEVQVETPFGNFNFNNDLAITSFRSAAFFAQQTGGSANLRGSAYRLENTTPRMGAALDYESSGGDFPGDSGADVLLEENKKESRDIAAGSAFYLDIEVEAIAPIDWIKHAVPNTGNVPSVTGSEEGENFSLSEFYQTHSENYTIRIKFKGRFAIKRGSTGADIYYSWMGNTREIEDLKVMHSRLLSNTPTRTPIGPYDYADIEFEVLAIPSGELRKKIDDAGGIEAFARFLNEEFLKGNNDNLGDAIKKFLAANQDYTSSGGDF